LLAAGLAPAQDQPDPGAREQQEPTFEGPFVQSPKTAFGLYHFTATPALAETSSALAPPDPADSGYDGPPILSRAGSALLRKDGPLNAFGLYAQIVGVYDSGLTPAVGVGSKPVAAPASYGEETTIGASAAHRWRHGKLGIEYRGTDRQYTNAPAFDGWEHFLQVAYSGALAEHFALDIQNTLGATRLANGAFTYFPLTSLDQVGIPTNELFDSRTNYLQSRIDLTWQRTARWSFGLGGQGFVVRRESLLLAGLNGYNAHVNGAYRLTPRQTISASYDNTYFDFQRAFGNSRLETTAIGYSIRLTRKWELSSLAGAVRVNILGLTQVSLDPAIAALTGESSAFVTFANTIHLPVAEARLAHRMRTGLLAFDYSTSVDPGNGLYLTSRQTSGTAVYSYAPSRSLQLRGNLGYSQLSPLGQSLGKYSNLLAGIQVFYWLTRDTYLDVRYDYRRYATGDAILQKDSNRLSLGVAINLGETSAVKW
jgi:hypothetical protein